MLPIRLNVFVYGVDVVLNKLVTTVMWAERERSRQC
jgi:hypothetical protein